MRAPPEKDGFESYRDGGVTVHVGLEVMADHVKKGVIVFCFGMFDHCRVHLDDGG